MTRAAVLGSPIAHSLSPALHRAAYAALGLTDWAYDAVEVLPPDLPGFLSDLDDEWAGLSLTMPLKQHVLPLLDALSPLAEATGAANTVLLSGGRRTGDNTDVHGIVAALSEVGVRAVDSSVVLGGGATAISAMAALRDLGDPSPVVLVRDAGRAGPLLAAAERLGCSPDVADVLRPGGQFVTSATFDAVINTIPGDAPVPLSLDGLLLDVVYDPWPTALARAWSGPVIGGAVMLLHQAARQVELMTGRSAPLEAMRAALPTALLP